MNHQFRKPIAIVAHPEREKYALALSEKVQAECISWDDGKLGCSRNHLRALRYMMDSPTEWVIILEDDAVPVPDFRKQLEMALNWAPSHLVGLYVGRGSPPHWQAGISSVIAKNVCWLRCDTLLNAVGYAVKTKLIPVIVEFLEFTWKLLPNLPIDEAITRWAKSYDTSVSFTRPSLVDHLDIQAVDKNAKDKGKRVAWIFGERDCWNGSTASLEYVESW